MHFLFQSSRLRSHSAENTDRQGGNHILRDPRHSTDAAVSVQYR